jgi:hypothetical protein
VVCCPVSIGKGSAGVVASCLSETVAASDEDRGQSCEYVCKLHFDEGGKLELRKLSCALAKIARLLDCIELKVAGALSKREITPLYRQKGLSMVLFGSYIVQQYD